MSQLRHQNIVNVVGTSKNERVFIIVMEYLKGGCLQDRLIRPYPFNEFKEIALQICESLSFAHNNRILHGNLRPKNILFTEEGVVKIADFGFDQHYGGADGVENWYHVEGEERTGRSDIYAAGIIFYQMINGATDKLKWKDGQLVTTEELGATPEALQDLIHTMTNRKEEHRYRSFEQVLRDLREIEVEEKVVVVEAPKRKRVVKKKSKKPLIITLVVLLGIFGAEGYILYAGKGDVVMQFAASKGQKVFKWLQGQYSSSNLWFDK